MRNQLNYYARELNRTHSECIYYAEPVIRDTLKTYPKSKISMALTRYKAWVSKRNLDEMLNNEGFIAKSFIKKKGKVVYKFNGEFITLNLEDKERLHQVPEDMITVQTLKYKEEGLKNQYGNAFSLADDFGGSK